MKFILCLILVAGVSAGINEQLRFKDQGLLRTSSRASNQVVGDTRATHEVKFRHWCKGVAINVLENGAKSTKSKMICGVAWIKQQMDKFKAASIDVVAEAAKAAQELHAKTDGMATVGSCAAPLYKFFGMPEVPEPPQTQHPLVAHFLNMGNKMVDHGKKMTDDVLKLSAAFMKTLDANTLDKQIAELAIKDVTGAECPSCPPDCTKSLNSIKELFDYAFAAKELATLNNGAVKTAAAMTKYTVFLGTPAQAMQILSDKMCCQAGLYGGLTSSCPKPA